MNPTGEHVGVLNGAGIHRQPDGTAFVSVKETLLPERP
jgi:hypothetical protein